LLPQNPQLVASVCVLAQLLPQAVSPAAQPAAHLFCEQTRPPLQTVPHAPQLLPSETMFTQPAGQAESPAVQAHLPLEQLWPSAHFMLQAPQFWNSVCVFTHTELQLERPAAQVAAPPPPPEKDPPVPTLLPPVLPGGELLSLEQLAIKRKQPTTANKPACMRMVVCLSNLRALRKPDSRQSHSALAHCAQPTENSARCGTGFMSRCAAGEGRRRDTLRQLSSPVAMKAVLTLAVAASSKAPFVREMRQLLGDHGERLRADAARHVHEPHHVAVGNGVIGLEKHDLLT
jgi:hypothetical protein